ncbi:MAG TPA: kelch repeat-containing protein [Bacteroidia bacterium]|nr:kelch repeat-containing protein [Bacteroidia bacterium]
MKKLFTLTFILFSFFAQADYWTQKANYPVGGLEYPFSFSIGNKGYIGSGKDISGTVYDAFWQYDPATNVWTQKANFIGAARFQATGISIGTKGYVGLGLDPVSPLQDFWEYDPVTNLWTQKANFGGSARFSATGFSVGLKGYIGTGYNFISAYKDLWEYNPVTNSWSAKASIPGAIRSGANSFAIGNSGYVIGGFNFNLNYLSEVWEYNTVSNTWTQKANFPAGRFLGAAMAICDKGYYGVGAVLGTYYNDFWQYNPVTNAWIQKTNFSGLNRNEPAYFSIGSKGYIGVGGEDSGPLYNDFWEYTPDSACATGIDEFEASGLKFEVSPNPAKEFIVISYPPDSYRDGKENTDITITNVEGKKVYQKPLTPKGEPTINIPLLKLRAGVYFVEISNACLPVRQGKQRAVKKFIKE